MIHLNYNDFLSSKMENEGIEVSQEENKLGLQTECTDLNGRILFNDNQKKNLPSLDEPELI